MTPTKSLPATLPNLGAFERTAPRPGASPNLSAGSRDAVNGGGIPKSDVCRHEWQPFGFSFDGEERTKETKRCGHCGRTRIFKT